MCCSPRLLRTVKLRLASVARSPGEIASSLASMVSVCPGGPPGRGAAMMTGSPGPGRHSRVRTAVASGKWTTGIPWTSTCQIGPAARRQTSVHETSSGAASLIDSFWSREEVQPASVACGARLTKARSPATRTSAVVTDSPGRSGTSRRTADPTGVTRTTRVATCHLSPSVTSRSTRTNGGSVAGSRATAGPRSRARSRPRRRPSSPPPAPPPHDGGRPPGPGGPRRPALAAALLHELQAVLRQAVLVQPFDAPAPGPRLDTMGLQRQGNRDRLAVGQRSFHQDLVVSGRHAQPQSAVSRAHEPGGRLAVHRDPLGEPLLAAPREWNGRLRRGADFDAGAQGRRADLEHHARAGGAVRAACGGLQEPRAQLGQHV